VAVIFELVAFVPVRMVGCVAVVILRGLGIDLDRRIGAAARYVGAAAPGV
jgi:hypothetical protein